MASNNFSSIVGAQQVFEQDIYLAKYNNCEVMLSLAHESSIHNHFFALLGGILVDKALKQVSEVNEIWYSTILAFEVEESICLT